MKPTQTDFSFEFGQSFQINFFTNLKKNLIFKWKLVSSIILSTIFGGWGVWAGGEGFIVLDVITVLLNSKKV